MTEKTPDFENEKNETFFHVLRLLLIAAQKAEHMAFLYEILKDGSVGEFWTLDEKPVVVGRGECADIYVEDGAMSRSHFLLVREAKSYFVIDLDSQNGTWLGRERVNGRRLRSGDVIQAGQSRFCFTEQGLEQTAPAAARTRATVGGQSGALAT